MDIATCMKKINLLIPHTHHIGVVVDHYTCVSPTNAEMMLERCSHAVSKIEFEVKMQKDSIYYTAKQTSTTSTLSTGTVL